jgi:hypothetical protein
MIILAARPPAVGAVLALVLGLVGAMTPAAAEDNMEVPPPAGCAITFGGPELPTGSVFPFPPGFPVPGGSSAAGGTYLCIDGRWVLVQPTIGPGGPIFMAGAPLIGVDAAAVTVEEGDLATNDGTWEYFGEEPVVLSASVGTVVGSPSSWSWSYTPDDGPADSQTVSVYASAGERVNEVRFDLVVDNVAPTMTTVDPDRDLALVGDTVSFTAAAADPSAVDTASGFSFAFDGVAGENPSEVAFDTCGSKTVSVTASDKDGGVSEAFTSTGVVVVDAGFAPPLQAGVDNLVQAGQVVPVRVWAGCDGLFESGLAPRIALLGPGGSVLNSGGVMAEVGHSYLYRLRVPTGPAGTRFTVEVEPFAGGDDVLAAVLQLRT